MHSFGSSDRLGLVFGVALWVLGASAIRAEGPALPPSVVIRSSPEPIVPLAAHKATYRVTLLKAVGSKSPTSARGKVAYEFSGSSCEGYTQTFRQMTELQPAEGATRLSDMRSTTYEDPDETGFSFDVKTTVDSNPSEVVDGSASKTKHDVLAIRLSKPNAQTINVDNDVLFPTAHLKRIIAAAKAGDRILAAKVFDGSDDGKKVYDTTTIIGRVVGTPAPDAGSAHVAAMDTMRRWPVTISYFDVGKKDEEPAYVLGFELYENGVSRALRFDYGDFVLGGELATLELRPVAACRKG